MKSRIHYSKKIRQFNALIKLLKKNRFSSLSEKNSLIEKAKRLYEELSNKLSYSFVKKVTASLSLALIIAIGGNELQAQSFGAEQNNPFGILPVFGQNTNVGIADIDNDGDFDFYSGGTYASPYFSFSDIYYYENTGTALMPAYANSQSSPHGLSNTFHASRSLPDLVDLDNDGDLDMLTGDLYGGFNYYQNNGTASAPNFATSTINPFGLAASGGENVIKFIDLDGDADYDIVSGNINGELVFYENTGTSSAPAFAAGNVNPYGMGITLTGYSLNFAAPTFSDLDNDGDFDLLVGLKRTDASWNQDYVLCYLENIGTATAPSYGAPQVNPFGLTVTYGMPTPTFVDIDGDGDDDLMTGEQFANFHFYENTTPQNNNLPASQDTSITTDEDLAYNFTVQDFPFYDINPTDTFSAIQIIQTTMQGSIDLLGNTIGNNDTIPYSDITNLVYTPQADEYGMNYDLFTFKVSDGHSFSSSTYTMDIHVNPLNDAPSAADKTITLDEDDSYTFSKNDFGFTDVDSSDSLNAITIESITSTGNFELAGIAVTTGQIIDVADITSLVFTPLANENGVNYDSFTFTVNDGTTNSATANTIQLDVNPVNDAPNSADNAVTTDENVAYSFTALDFAFSDIDAGDMLSGVRIETATSVGDLTLSGAAVSAGDDISVADIPNLVFTPVMDEFGMNYDSFTFKVSDGTTNSDSVYTMQINVTEVMDTTTDTTDTTGIRLINSIESLNAYPNPFVNIIEISFENNSNQNAILTLYDLNGKIILDRKVSEKGKVNQVLDVQHLEKGMYFLQIEIDRKKSVIKLVK